MLHLIFMADEKDPRIITPMPQALVDRIDDYRFKQRIPSRAEAIRTLIDRALNQDAGRVVAPDGRAIAVGGGLSGKRR